MEPTQKAPKIYDPNFKRSAVDLLLSSGRPLKQIARELGVEPSTLRGWKKKLAAAAPVNAVRTPAELEAENRALRQELSRVKTQRDILKKTLGILSIPEGNDSNA
jgi:transposase